MRSPQPVLVVSVLAIVVTLLAACQRPEPPLEKGTLVGTVTIGPLCPTEPCTPDPAVLREAYLSRKVLVTDKATGITKKVLISPGGTYQTVLPVGAYSLGIEEKGVLKGTMPDPVNIAANETTRADVHIDTGLR